MGARFLHQQFACWFLGVEYVLPTSRDRLPTLYLTFSEFWEVSKDQLDTSPALNIHY